MNACTHDLTLGVQKKSKQRPKGRLTLMSLTWVPSNKQCIDTRGITQITCLVYLKQIIMLKGGIEAFINY